MYLKLTDTKNKSLKDVRKMSLLKWNVYVIPVQIVLFHGNLRIFVPSCNVFVVPELKDSGERLIAHLL